MKILLVGAGGYGTFYVQELLKNQREDVSWEGIVDPYIANASEYENIKAAKIPVYNTMEEFYAQHDADLVLISTPPFLHREQCIKAVKHGASVLCEKPAAPTLGEAEQMLEAERESGRFIAIGYQWSFSPAIQKLKRDILDGVLGAPVFFKTLISWPRNFAYYRRGGGWGGRIAKDGITVLDSIASNACAHYLHNMLFLVGEEMNKSARAESVEGDCLRANEIETFDTCTIRVRAKGVPMLFVASHAAEAAKNPSFIYRFEKAEVRFSEEDGVIRAIFSDGREICYGNPFENNFRKIWDCVEALKAGTRPICTVETAMEHTALIGMLHEKLEYRDFDKSRVTLNEKEDGLCVKGLYEELLRAYGEEKLLSEL